MGPDSRSGQKVLELELRGPAGITNGLAASVIRLRLDTLNYSRLGLDHELKTIDLGLR